MTLKTLTLWLALCIVVPVCRADLPKGPPPEAAPSAAPASTDIAAMAASQAPESGGTAFQASDPSKLKENLDGLPFLVGAYAAIWAALFVFVVLVHRRAGKLEAEVVRLREDIARAVRSGGAP